MMDQSSIDEQRDPLIAQSLIKQALDLWIGPEVERRKEEGVIDETFVVKAAQIIFSMGGTNQVRLNSEVKVIAKAKLTDAKEKGEAVLDKEVLDILSLDLVEEDKDFGHITIVNINNHYYVSFSFIYDITTVEELYQMGNSFLAVAQHCLQKGLMRPFVANLFVAAENIAKARIFLLPDKEIRKVTKHKHVIRVIDKYRTNSDVIKEHQWDAIKELERLRDRARYKPGEFVLNSDEANRLLSAIESMCPEILQYINRHKVHENVEGRTITIKNSPKHSKEESS